MWQRVLYDETPKKKLTFKKFTYRGFYLAQMLDKKKKEARPKEKPQILKKHRRNMIIVSELTGTIIGVYNGKNFGQVEGKPEMIGDYLGEFALTYKHVKHGRPGIGATHSFVLFHSSKQIRLHKFVKRISDYHGNAS